MKVLGIDFTSAPKRYKPIMCVACRFEGGALTYECLKPLPDFLAFECILGCPGPWVAGIDFPFAQSRRFVENAGWPRDWAAYVRKISRWERTRFREELDRYKAARQKGDKQHKRRCDEISNSQSPQTQYGTPVGLMFFEGAPRLLHAGVHIPHLHNGDTKRTVLEAYPGIAARMLIGARPYKSDTKSKQTPEQLEARQDLLGLLLESACSEKYGFNLDAPMALADDPTGDELDALLCAMQAAWGFSRRDRAFGAPASGYDRLEGWICDPALEAGKKVITRPLL